IPPQEPPYTPLIHSARTQPQQTRENIKPSILPFFTPQLFHPIPSPPFHIHFPNHHRHFPPHILHFQLDHLTVQIQNFQTFQQHLPVDPKSFTHPHIHYKHIPHQIREPQ
uniref:acetolactate decarboxylase n=1 Tax=Staphylococcus epidermidis TaxID=1282 RepID=UPI001642FE1E